MNFGILSKTEGIADQLMNDAQLVCDYCLLYICV